MAQRQKTEKRPARGPDAGEPAKKNRRPEKHVPTDRTRAQVEALRAYGQSDRDICAVLKIKSTTTLYKHYSETLRMAKPIRHARWAAELEGIALGRRVNPETGEVEKMDVKPRDRAGVLMFLVETQASWRRASRVEVANPDGTSIAPVAGGGFAVVAMIPDNGRDPDLKKHKVTRDEVDNRPPANPAKQQAKKAAAKA